MIDWIRCKNSAKAHWALWVALAMLAGYGVFIGANHAPVASGADSGGYLSSAKLLSQGRLTTSIRSVPEVKMVNSWEQTPLGFQLIPGDTILRPTYPIGLPLHYAAAGLVAGWYWGPMLVAVFAALVVLVVCYLCAREMGVGPLLAASGSVAVGVSPLFLFTSFTPMSDVVATAWCSIAFLAGLRAKRGSGWAILSGAAFSIAVLVRPANLIFFPVLIILLWNWRNLFWGGLGALPAAVVNGLYNQFMWGSPFLSGYGTLDGAFSRSFFLPTLVNYVKTLPLVLPLMFVGLFLLPFLSWRKRPRELSACLLWAVLFMGFYAFYVFTSTTWWFLRFILPAFPALVILSVSGLDAILQRKPGGGSQTKGIVVAVVVVAFSLAGSIWTARDKHFMLMKAYQEPYVKVCDWVTMNLPPGSLIACLQTSSAIYYYTDFPVLRWDATEPNAYANLKIELQKTGRPFYAVLLSHEVKEALEIRLPGSWRKIKEFKSFGGVSFDVWKLDPAK